MAFICLKPNGNCEKCVHYRYDEDKGRNACFAQVDNENKTNLNYEKFKKYPFIEKTKDKQYLYNHLSEPALKDIEHILEAYSIGAIDFEVPEYEDGTPDFSGEFKLIIVDDSYEKIGCELLVLKWIEDYEDTEYLIEFFK